MIQLAMVAKQGGVVPVAFQELPLSIGRRSGCGLRLEEKGVWDDHAVLLARPGKGVQLEVNPGAVVWVNGSRVERTTRLGNGDRIDLGGVQIEFGFTPNRQRSFRMREVLTFAAVGVLCLGQLALVYWGLP